MPRISRYLLKTSLIWFGIGLTLGMLLLMQKAAGLYGEIWKLLPFHIEIMLFGWLIQFVMGVAYWMLPRYLKGPARDKAWKGWSLWGLFNLGILLSLTAHFTTILPFHVIGRCLQLISIVIFVHIHWQRIAVLRRKVS